MFKKNSAYYDYGSDDFEYSFWIRFLIIALVLCTLNGILATCDIKNTHFSESQIQHYINIVNQNNIPEMSKLEVEDVIITREKQNGGDLFQITKKNILSGYPAINYEVKDGETRVFETRIASEDAYNIFLTIFLTCLLAFGVNVLISILFD